MNPRSKVIRSLILTLFFFGMVALPLSTYAGTGKKSTSQKNAVTNSQAEKAPQTQQKVAQNSASPQTARAPESEENDPDLPSFLHGRMDKQSYLKLRSEYIGRIRGINVNHPPDPHIRMNAIRTMEQQEQRLYGNRFQSAAPGASGSIIPFTGPVWTELGPSPIPNGQTDPNFNITGEVAVSGRVTAIAVHPTNPNIVYVGAAQGGVFRSTDGGATWTPLMDSAQSLAIGAIAIAPSQPSTIYVGTGEANFAIDSFFGVGVYRIDNADTTPVLLGPLNKNGGSTDVFTGNAISQILVHPTDPNTIFVSTAQGFSGLSSDFFSTPPARGVFRSTNAAGPAGSATFTKLTVATANGGDRDVTDLAMEPGNPNNIVAAVSGFAAAGDGGYYRTTNALAATPTFTQTLQLDALTMKFAINKVGPTVTVLAGSGDGGGATGEVRVSTDGGATWGTPLTNATNYCGGQCFYDAVIAIKPDDANTFFLGGAAGIEMLQKTTNGGVDFSLPNISLHADTHAIVYAPSDFTIMYEGNDGGVWRSADGGNTWTTRNTAGFKATQFQSLALHPTDRNFMIGGTQDNGTIMMNPDGTWFRADAGDGGYALIDQSTPDPMGINMYHTYFNRINDLVGYAQVTGEGNASENNWNFSGCIDGITPANGITCGDSVLFYAPMALGPGSPNTVYYGTDRLYRSADVGNNNTVVSQAPLITGGGSGINSNAAISAIAISPQNDNVRIVGMENGKVFGTITGSSTLTDITGSIPPFYVARAIIGPDQNTAFVTLDGYGLAAGQHIWKTTNLNGAPPTWTASGNGIPDVPVNSIAIDRFHSNFIYAATDIGVYFSPDAGLSWNPYGGGLPRVACFDIAVNSPNHVVRVATHGRGIWEIPSVTRLATTTTLASSANPSAFPTTVTFTANVTPITGVAVPAGSVAFMDGATLLGTNTLAAGSTTFTTNALSIGSHSITAVYNGSTDFGPSTSSPVLTQTVTGTTAVSADISVAISHVPNNPVIPFGGRITFTVTVTNLDTTNSAAVALNLSSIGGLELDAVTPPGGSSCNPPTAGNAIECSIPTLAANSHVAFTVSLRPLYSGSRTFTVIAAEASNTTDSTTADNIATDVIKVRFKPFRK